MPSLCKRKISSAKVQLYYNVMCLLYLLILLFVASCSKYLRFWVQKKIFLSHSDIYYSLILGYIL